MKYLEFIIIFCVARKALHAPFCRVKPMNDTNEGNVKNWSVFLVLAVNLIE